MVIKKTAVLGAGIMGHGIAQCFLMAGFPVRLYDIEEGILGRARGHIEQNLAMFAAHGLIHKGDIEPCLKGLSLTTDLKEAVQEADFITEAAPENLELKQTLFASVDRYCPGHAIIASNTSSLTMEKIGERVSSKDRLVTTHWFNPPHIVPAVEVVRSPWTSEETFNATYELLIKIRKVPIKINREIPGFLINRIQMAMVREILDLYEQGIAGAEDIDRAVKGSIGFRLASIGPLLTIDLGGLKLWLKVCENLFPLISSAKEPPASLKRLAEQGCDGIKSGRGFYDYSTPFSKENLDEAIKKRDREFLNRLKSLYWDEGKVP
jgi:3-hydroxyacyl-CoA dehydrogenase